MLLIGDGPFCEVNLPIPIAQISHANTYLNVTKIIKIDDLDHDFVSLTISTLNQF